MAVALAIFVAVLGMGVFVLVHGRHTHTSGKIVNNSQKIPDKLAAEGAFFYHAIGRVSRDLGLGSPAALAPGKTRYTLEFQMVTSRDQAEAAIDTLHKKGIDAYFTPLAHGGHVIYRVRRGIYTTPKAARQAALALRSQHAVAAKVVMLQ